MEQCWRWFGPHDSISLNEVAQAGATGVVTALHELPAGCVWPLEAIQQRKAILKEQDLEWSVVESVHVHRDIQLRQGDFRSKIEAYTETLRNLAQAGVSVVCYNFMPVVDWTRTDLGFRMKSGAGALRFDVVHFAAYDIHVLSRAGAVESYSEQVCERARDYMNRLSESEVEALEKNVIAGLPGGERAYDRQKLKAEIETFRALGEERLRNNLVHFLGEITPVARECGVRLAIHPDDPPFSLFGLPRVVSTAQDVRNLFEAVPAMENGLTLCAGSFGARGDNDLIRMAKEFGPRIHFVHLRNVTIESEYCFHEAEHLYGDTDIVGLISALLSEEDRRRRAGRTDISLPMRPDHGHAIGDEIGDPEVKPGYSYQGRLKGLAELRGVIHTLQWQARNKAAAEEGRAPS